jgi:hypothetical protein
MNYIIEGNLNFNQELIKSICNTDEDETSKNCLISGMPLNEEYITLRCGHQFNYESIFKEVKRQKKEINYLETARLNKTQIKCPYCRNIQEGLLPFCEEKIKGVNWPPKYSYSTQHCKYIMRSGKRKGNDCNALCFGKRCYKHFAKKNIQYCNAIIKSGKNKGQKCKCKSFKNGFCKRHFKKEIVIKT